jgi:Helix-turn-helix.
MISPTALTEARILAGLSQRETARRVELGYQTIRRMELGEFSGNLTLRSSPTSLKRSGSAWRLCCRHSPRRPGPLSTTLHSSLSPRRAFYGVSRTERRSPRSLSAVERQVILPALRRQGLLTKCSS